MTWIVIFKTVLLKSLKHANKISLEIITELVTESENRFANSKVKIRKEMLLTFPVYIGRGIQFSFLSLRALNAINGPYTF